MAIILDDATYSDIDSAKAFVEKMDAFLDMPEVRADAGYVKIFELRRSNALKFIEGEKLKLAGETAGDNTKNRLTTH
jgi:hypothetical protein